MKNKILIFLAILSFATAGFILGRRSCCLEKLACINRCNILQTEAEQNYAECANDVNECKRWTNICLHVTPANRQDCEEKAFAICERAWQCQNAYQEAMADVRRCREKCNCSFWGILTEN
jgi:hypothetical protein